MLLDENHPVVQWVRREVLPLLIERLAPTRVIVFDPPDRSAAVGEHPPGLLVVSPRFRGVPVAERNLVIRALLAAASPIRPLCLTPSEFDVAQKMPGPVMGAAKTGVTIL